MKSFIPFCLFILFSLSISYNPILQLSKMLGLEQILFIVDDYSDDTKAEDSENKNLESYKDLFYAEDTRQDLLRFCSNKLNTTENKNILLFHSHSYTEEIFSPPDFS